MTASELQEMIVTMLARQRGGTQRRWRTVVGPVRLQDIRAYPHCNWSVTPQGGTREVAEVERLLDSIRLTQPIVSEG